MKTQLARFNASNREDRTTNNPTVYNRLMRYELSCSYCRPNRGENKKHHRKHGVQKKRKHR